MTEEEMRLLEAIQETANEDLARAYGEEQQRPALIVVGVIIAKALDRIATAMETDLMPGIAQDQVKILHNIARLMDTV